MEIKMEQVILENVDFKELKQWLTIVCMPFLREPAFFEAMGFSPCFVRQFLKKHRYVLLSGGAIQRKVRGVNEIDFLYGLAEVMGIAVSAINRNINSNSQAGAIGRECLHVLDELSGDINNKEMQHTSSTEMFSDITTDRYSKNSKCYSEVNSNGAGTNT